MIWVSLNKKQMKKIRPIKNTWNDWLINYIPEPIRKRVGGFKDKIVSLFKTNTPKQLVYGRGNKPKETKIRNIRNPFILKNKKEIIDRITRDFLWNRRSKRRKKEIRRKTEYNKTLVKDRLIRDIRTLFEQEENYCKIINFWNNNYIEYESNGDKNRNLSLKEYFNKNEPYLRNTIIDLQNFDAWKIQLTIAINFMSSKDDE